MVVLSILFSFGLTLALIILKLNAMILWPWWLVLAPLWFGAAIVIFVLGVLMILIFGTVLLKAALKK